MPLYDDSVTVRILRKNIHPIFRISVRLGVETLAVVVLVMGMALVLGRTRSDSLVVALTSGSGMALDIYLADLKRGLTVNLTRSVAWDGYPALSPDGLRVAFTSFMNGDGDLYVLDIYTQALIQLTDDPPLDSSAAWSPDGQQIVFVSEQNNDRDLYVVSASGGPARQLTHEPGPATIPAWSPDGQQIAFVLARDNDPADIYLMDADGGHIRRVTTHLGYDWNPVWSPDGRYLAFISDRGGHEADVYLIETALLADSALENARRVSDQPLQAAQIGWLPDSQTLLLLSLLSGQPQLYALPVNCEADDCVPVALTDSRLPLLPWHF